MQGGGWQGGPGPGPGGGYGAGGGHGAGGPTAYQPPVGYGPTQPSAYGGPMMPQAQPLAYGDYEFNALENTIIDKTANRAKLWGWISSVLGVCQLLFGTCGSLANAGMALNLPSGIILVVVGFTFIGVGNSLKHVVVTQGNDVGHMMQALQKLGTAFLVQSVAFVAMLVVSALIAILVFFVMVASAAGH